MGEVVQVVSGYRINAFTEIISDITQVPGPFSLYNNYNSNAKLKHVTPLVIRKRRRDIA